MRHGEAGGTYNGEEPSLSVRGESEVDIIGKALSSYDVQINRIYHSGKLRARQTAEIVKNKLGTDIPISGREGLKPNDSAAIFAEGITEIQEDTLIVGHLPFMAKLAAYLLTTAENDWKFSFSTASVVCLENIPSSGWKIHWFINPEIVAQSK